MTNDEWQTVDGVLILILILFLLGKRSAQRVHGGRD